MHVAGAVGISAALAKSVRQAGSKDINVRENRSHSSSLVLLEEVLFSLSFNIINVEKGI